MKAYKVGKLNDRKDIVIEPSRFSFEVLGYMSFVDLLCSRFV